MTPLKLKLVLTDDDKEIQSFSTESTYENAFKPSDLIGLIDSTMAWLEKQKKGLEKLEEKKGFG